MRRSAKGVSAARDMPSAGPGADCWHRSYAPRQRSRRAGTSDRLSLRSALAGRRCRAESNREPSACRGPSRRPVTVLYVLKTANDTRVRDGYIRLSTRGHARTRSTRLEDSICRKNVPASVRPCPPVPPLNLHGKEGVDGSSPSEGFTKALQNGLYCCRSGYDSILAGTKRIQVPGLVGTRGQAQRRTSPSDTTRRGRFERITDGKTCKHESFVVFLGAPGPPPGREEVESGQE